MMPPDAQRMSDKEAPLWSFEPGCGFQQFMTQELVTRPCLRRGSPTQASNTQTQTRETAIEMILFYLALPTTSLLSGKSSEKEMNGAHHLWFRSAKNIEFIRLWFWSGKKKKKKWSPWSFILVCKNSSHLRLADQGHKLGSEAVATLLSGTLLTGLTQLQAEVTRNRQAAHRREPVGLFLGQAPRGFFRVLVCGVHERFLSLNSGLVAPGVKTPPSAMPGRGISQQPWWLGFWKALWRSGGAGHVRILYQGALGLHEGLHSRLSYLSFRNQYLVLSHRGLGPALSHCKNESQSNCVLWHHLVCTLRSWSNLGMSPWNMAKCTPMSLLHFYVSSTCAREVSGSHQDFHMTVHKN